MSATTLGAWQIQQQIRIIIEDIASKWHREKNVEINKEEKQEEKKKERKSLFDKK